MFDIGWQELLVIAVVALIVIGPKDLPRALKAITQWIGKLRALAHDFQRGLDDVVREAELDDLKKKLTETTSTDIARQIENTIDPTGEISKNLDLNQVEQDLQQKARAMTEGEASSAGEPPKALPSPESSSESFPAAPSNTASAPVPPADKTAGGT